MAGKRNEKARRVLASSIDEINLWPGTKTGVRRVTPAIAGAFAVAPGQNHNGPPQLEEVGGSRFDAIVTSPPCF